MTWELWYLAMILVALVCSIYVEIRDRRNENVRRNVTRTLRYSQEYGDRNRAAA